jgi:aminocarboxymuconate-semialdehyde decarboxylase
MTVIDLHAHVTPERYKKAIADRGEWYGLDSTVGELSRGGFARPITDRIAEMDQLGVDMQLITPTVGFYQYAMDAEVAAKLHRECNAEIAEIVEQYPDRFRGMAMLTMQNPGTAIAEMAQAIEDGFAGVVLSDHVGDVTYDDPRYLPFFAAAEELGAILFFHQGGGDTIISSRTNRYKLTNAIGNLVERTIVYATLVFSGIMDRFPDLKPLLAHGGGYTAFGIARMDKVAGALEGPAGELTPPFSEADGFNQKLPPSDYLSRFHYDCCTYSGPALRYLIDTVGIDRVSLGTDYPAPMFLKDPVDWVNGLPELAADEKQAILETNPAALLGLDSGA